MCGIAGILTAQTYRSEELTERAVRMSACLAHRGPDDSGAWTDASSGVALSFQRLSIIDLSEAGHQPMRSGSGRYTVVQNGEIYNYRELGEELARQGVAFRGTSDTEVMCAAFDRWGVETAVTKFIGMFAIAVWDSSNRTLSLIRDRLGIKPLFYSHRPGLLLFGSELKALMSSSDFDRAVDPESLRDYLRFLYVPAPRTIFRSARKLLPGHILTVRAGAEQITESRSFWSVNDVYERALSDPFAGSDAEAVEELERLLTDSVRLRMRADVPMGALLSGGVDSSAIVALMQASATEQTRTFTIAFPGSEHDEAAHASRVANQLRTSHTEMAVTGDEALQVVPLLPAMFDEPFADPSAIPTHLVSKLARQDVTVALSGDGGDELFAGYERYVRGESIIQQAVLVPRAIRRAAGAGIGAIDSQIWNRASEALTAVSAGSNRQRLVGQKAKKLGKLLSHDSEAAMYRSLLSAWQEPDEIVSEAAAGQSRIDALLASHARAPLLDRMMIVDQQTYLADDLLAKLDRASMAVGLEARVPILDHRVVEFSWRLPRRMKVRDGRGKWILREVLYRHIDRSLVDRPKTGFSVPVASWLRGPLQSWGEELLFSDSALAREWIRMEEVTRAWKRLQEGDSEPELAVWAILMFRAWQTRWLN